MLLLIITSLFQVMPAVGNVAGVVFALQLVFAILGLQLFMGGFGSCSDGEITTEAECQGTHGARRALLGLVTPHGRFLRGGGSSSDADDTEVGEALEWRNELPFSFDSFGATMLTLFVMATGDGWDEVMFVGMDSRGPGLAPQRRAPVLEVGMRRERRDVRNRVRLGFAVLGGLLAVAVAIPVALARSDGPVLVFRGGPFRTGEPVAFESVDWPALDDALDLEIELVGARTSRRGAEHHRGTVSLPLLATMVTNRLLRHRMVMHRTSRPETS